MARKFVVETATLNCQYGEKTCGLKPYEDRHISACRKNFANEGDMSGENVCGFGTCGSPYMADFALKILPQVNGTKLWQETEFRPQCVFRSEIAWQNSNETVCIGTEGYRALMEDGWTMCSNGLGLITLVDTGQAEEDKIQKMLEQLEELEKVLDKYMEEKGIGEEQRDELLESVLLWNVYPSAAISWSYESNEMKRDFCAYLQEENASLANYFERGLYVQDKEGQTIDAGYMLGTYKALEQNKIPWNCINESVIEDEGMYNGYLEACCQESGKGCGEVLKGFLLECQSDDYDGSKRYSSYTGLVNESMRELYGWNIPNMEEMSLEEQNMAVTKVAISNNLKEKVIDEGQETEMEELTNRFISRLREDIARGE